MNKGIEMATGEYFIYLSSDDYIDPEVIARHVSFLEKACTQNVVGCYGDYTIINENSKVVSYKKRHSMNVNNHFLDVVQRKNEAVLSASTIKMSVVKDIKFDPDIFLGDWDFFLNLSQKYVVLYVPGNAYFYRQVETGMNRNLEKMFEAREQIFNKYKSNERLNEEYGIDKFRAQILIANAISFFHTNNCSDAKPFIIKALKYDLMTVLKKIDFVLKIYMGNTVVHFFRQIKHMIFRRNI